MPVDDRQDRRQDTALVRSNFLRWLRILYSLDIRSGKLRSFLGKAKFWNPDSDMRQWPEWRLYNRAEGFVYSCICLMHHWYASSYPYTDTRLRTESSGIHLWSGIFTSSTVNLCQWDESKLIIINDFLRVTRAEDESFHWCRGSSFSQPELAKEEDHSTPVGTSTRCWNPRNPALRWWWWWWWCCGDFSSFKFNWGS